MYVVILNVDSARRARWYSMWYDGNDPMSLVSMLREKARSMGETYGSMRVVPLDGEWHPLFLELHARHDAIFRMVCLHAFISGYCPTVHSRIPLPIQVPADPALAPLHREIVATELGRTMLEKLQVVGSACAMREMAEG